MTALCPGGGTSSPKPGTPAAVAFVGDALSAAVTKVLGLWGIPLAGLIGAFSVNTVESCSTDPPADPNMGPLDWAGLFSNNLVLQVPAGIKFNQLFTRLMWFQLCQCDQNPQPTPPPPIAQPTGMPTVNAPGTYVPRPQQPCWSHSDHNPMLDTIFVQRFLVFPASTVHAGPETGYVYSNDAPLQYQATLTINADGTINASGFIELQYTNSSGGIIRNDISPTIAAGNSVTLTSVPPAGAFGVDLTVHSTTSMPNNSADVNLQIFCPDSAITNPNSPCGPLDPAAWQLLNTILQLVTIIQRQDAPFAYLKGAQHTNLSGTGQIAVSGLLGVIVTPTTVPASYGSAAGTPTELFNVGWINWGTPDGYPTREFIGPNPMTSFPCRAGLFTFIAYTLRPGVVVTITEIVREP